MAVTPTRAGYQLPNGQWVAPTEAFGYGQNPYDPETQPALYQQWEFAHQGEAQQIGQDYSPGRVGAIIGGTVAAGALGDLIAGGGAAGGVSGGGSSTGLVGGAGTIADTPPFVLPASTSGTLSSLSAPAAATTFGAPSGGAGGAGILGGTGAAPETIATTAAAAGGTGAARAGGSLLTSSRFWDTVLGGLGLGADLYANRQAQQATQTATNQLIAAGQQAQAQNNRIYGGTTSTLSDILARQQQNLAPYTSLGSGAASLLGYGLGIPGGITAAPSGVYTPPADPFGAGSSPAFGGGNLRPPPNSTLAQTFTPGETSPYVPSPTPTQPFPGTTASAMTTQPNPLSTLETNAPQRQTQSSYTVTMRAPTGETEQVPAHQVSWYQSHGAVVV